MTLTARTGVVAAALTAAAGLGGALVFTRPSPDTADPVGRTAAWAATACAATGVVQAERTPAATRALHFDLRHASDGAQLRSITLAHLDALERRFTPLVALLEMPDAPARVSSLRPAITEALAKFAAARASIAATAPGSDTLESTSSDAIYDAEEAEEALLLIACPPANP